VAQFTQFYNCWAAQDGLAHTGACSADGASPTPAPTYDGGSGYVCPAACATTFAQVRAAATALSLSPHPPPLSVLSQRATAVSGARGGGR
jgi:hypothetical protein